MSGWARAYLVTGAGLVALFGAGEFLGWETGTAARHTIERSVRQSPGGWRSWTFWHQGTHGGK